MLDSETETEPDTQGVRKFRICLSGKKSDQKSAELHLTINFHFSKVHFQKHEHTLQHLMVMLVSVVMQIILPLNKVQVVPHLLVFLTHMHIL